MKSGIRITGGRERGRPIKSPRDERIRPTSSKVRQAIFNILGHQVRGATVLDLYCGVGLLSLEALSRGAKAAVLVDNHRESVGIARENLERLTYTKRGRVVQAELPSALDERLGGPFTLVFSDPPYASDVRDKLAERLLEVVAPEARWVHEGPKRALEIAWEPAGWEVDQVRRYGETVIWMLSPR